MPVCRQSLFKFLAVLLILTSCDTTPNNVTRAYYYWRSDSFLTFAERAVLKANQVKKLYRKILDVDWNDIQGAIPVASGRIASIDNDLNQYDSFGINIIPVIFITNKTFQRIDSADIPVLASRILRRCLPKLDSIDANGKHYYDYNDRNSPLTEIQFDCDWTVATAKKYFYFLQTVHSLLPDKKVNLSVTIRLHQYKYPGKTGIPPVDRGMLMVYNISNIKEHSPVNSIFDYDKAKAYFSSGKKYPLPLDIALPAFSWCLIFRKGQFYQIDNGLARNNLDSCSFLQASKNGFYKVIRDTVYRELFLRLGDEIKAETISDKQLQQAASLAQTAVNTKEFSISLFELSENEIKNYNHETIDAVYRSFR
jgi:hypothetical protein